MIKQNSFDIHFQSMIKKSKLMQFSKTRPSLYRLTDKQIKQFMRYLTYNINQEELNNAIGYTTQCPYCKSEDYYKTEMKSNLYKFKCESCNKKFTDLNRNVISDLLKEEYIKSNNRYKFQEALKNIEVWLYFDIEFMRRTYTNISRKNNISTTFRWKHNMLQIPKDIKNDHLVNMHERNKKSFLELLYCNKPSVYTQNKKYQDNKKFIIVTFKEGKYVPKQSIDTISEQMMKVNHNAFDNYQDNVRNKAIQQRYQYLKDVLIKSYSDDCEILQKPSREDKVYRDIEIPYKHTYVLAYEMAIRNREVKKILYVLRYLKDIKLNQQLITNRLYKNQDSSVATASKAYEIYEEDIRVYKEALLSKYPYYLDENLHQQYLSIGFSKINSLVDDFEEELRKKYLIIPKENKIITPESSRISIQRAIYNSIDPQKYKWSQSKQLETQYKFEEKVYEGYTNTMGVFEGDDVFDISVLRPTFNLHLIDKNSSYIPINLTLPIEEITAFIEKIKDDLKKNKDIIKAPMELLGEEIERIDEANIEKYLDKSFNGKLKSMSDALFAYDMFQYLSRAEYDLRAKRDKLQNELNGKLLDYKKFRKKTNLQRAKENRISKEYIERIEEYNQKINHIALTADLKYYKISNLVKVERKISTIERYISFMSEYIEEEKYKRLFLKTR